MHVKTVNKIEMLPRKDWEAVFPDISESYSYFKTLEESRFEDFSFYYVIVYDHDGSPVGAAPCFVMNFPLDLGADGWIKSFFKPFHKITPGLIRPKTVMCGLPTGQAAIGVAGDKEKVVEHILKGLEKIAEEHKAPLIIFKDFNASYNQLLQPLFKKKFFRMQSFPFTQMRLDFKTFDEYLKTLSRSSRDGLKRHLKKIDAEGRFKMEVKGALSEDELKEVHDLYTRTAGKQGMSFEKLAPEYFRNVSVNMPDQTKFFLWRRDGKLAAFALCFHSGDNFIDYYVGFDYSFTGSFHMYSLRFRGMMEWCLNNGVKMFEMGVTSYEIKRRLGLDFIRLYFYARHRNPVINYLIARLSALVAPEKFDPVFKYMDELERAAR